MVPAQQAKGPAMIARLVALAALYLLAVPVSLVGRTLATLLQVVTWLSEQIADLAERVAPAAPSAVAPSAPRARRVEAD